MFESLCNLGFDNVYRQGHRCRRGICRKQRGHCHVHDCGEFPQVLTSFGHILFNTIKCDHIGHNQRRDNLLLNYRIPVDVLPVLHESVRGPDLDYNDDQGHGGRKWNFTERYVGCDLYDCRE